MHYAHRAGRNLVGSQPSPESHRGWNSLGPQRLSTDFKSELAEWERRSWFPGVQMLARKHSRSRRQAREVSPNFRPAIRHLIIAKQNVQRHWHRIPTWRHKGIQYRHLRINGCSVSRNSVVVNKNHKLESAESFDRAARSSKNAKISTHQMRLPQRI